jgi:hypothetical protein
LIISWAVSDEAMDVVDTSVWVVLLGMMEDCGRVGLLSFSEGACWHVVVGLAFRSWRGEAISYLPFWIYFLLYGSCGMDLMTKLWDIISPQYDQAQRTPTIAINLINNVFSTIQAYQKTT